MSLPDFKTQIKNIRKEAIELGFSISTMNSYEQIWKQFIKWKKDDNFIYDSDNYANFLLEHYNFDVSTYAAKSKSRHQQLMRSKRILDDFDSYKTVMKRKMFPKSLYSEYPNEWNAIIDNYLKYIREVKQNAESSINLKRDYIKKELSYFYQKGLTVSEISSGYVL